MDPECEQATVRTPVKWHPQVSESPSTGCFPNLRGKKKMSIYFQIFASNFHIIVWRSWVSTLLVTYLFFPIPPSPKKSDFPIIIMWMNFDVRTLNCPVQASSGMTRKNHSTNRNKHCIAVEVAGGRQPRWHSHARLQQLQPTADGRASPWLFLIYRI